MAGKIYDFDEIVPRRGTGCVKHDGMIRNFGSNDLLPMWVADMDFRSPDFVMEALRQRCAHEVLGYALPPDSYVAALQAWMHRHYQVDPSRDELHYIPGIVSGIAFAIQALTHEGDGVLITTPVYPPFVHLPQGGGRMLVCSRLVERDGRFYIDFNDLEQKARQCKLLILSNPHNPAGRVWTVEELRQVADICHRHGVTVISDEIHADMTLTGREGRPGIGHTSFSTVSDDARAVSITFFAPSKTFNIAGLSSSAAYVPNDDLRHRYFGYLDTYEVANGNIFAFVGAEAAFSQGEDWLRQMLDYLQGNVDYLDTFLRTRLPYVRAMLPEASYLPWLDFSAYGYSHEQMRDMLIHQAHVALNDGADFAPRNGAVPDPATVNHFRLNIGCPRAILREALQRIETIKPMSSYKG